MPRVGTNPDRLRFNLIIKKAYSSFDIPYLTQPLFIAKCYDWVEEFANIWKKKQSDKEYTDWLVTKGIGCINSGSDGVVGAEFPHGLINNSENRKKAAAKIQQNFEGEIIEEKYLYISKALIHYLGSEHKDGFILTYTSRVLKGKNKKINPESFTTYIRSYLIPSITAIKDPCEQFAAILIFAQSGCVPMDVFDDEIASCKAQIKELTKQINRLNELKNNNSFDIYRSRDYHELTDPFYCGTFYGYFRQFRNQYGETDYHGLVPFVLEISNDDNFGTNATLTFSRYQPNGETVPLKFIGKPMIGGQMIQIVLQRNCGDDIITMSYHWIDIKNNPLQCRFGVMIAQDRKLRCPQLQRFIFFNAPLKEENEKYVDAFLRLTDERFVVPQNKTDNLSQDASEFLLKYGKELRGYIISAEESIFAARFNSVSDRDIVRVLLDIEQQSLSPLVITSKENSQLSDFFRSMLTAEQHQTQELS